MVTMITPGPGVFEIDLKLSNRTDATRDREPRGFLIPMEDVFQFLDTAVSKKRRTGESDAPSSARRFVMFCEIRS